MKLIPQIIVDDNDDDDYDYAFLENVIRESSFELLQLTNGDDYSIDANAAITFIIILPNDDNE